MSNFRTIDRQSGFLLPPSVDEWLPEKHLARFVVEVIDGLDLRAMSGVYRGSGSASYHPRMLLGILVYGYATGVFSSRKLERATYDSVAFRFVAANDHPDHDTIASRRLACPLRRMPLDRPMVTHRYLCRTKVCGTYQPVARVPCGTGPFLAAVPRPTGPPPSS
jgi:hypothetical protein